MGGAGIQFWILPSILPSGIYLLFFLYLLFSWNMILLVIKVRLAGHTKTSPVICQA